MSSALGFPTVDPIVLPAHSGYTAPPPRLSRHSDRKPRSAREAPGDEAHDEYALPQPSAPVKHRQGSFGALGLSPALCTALSRKGYGFPTPIQRRVIPAIVSGRDVVAMARTGSGKTAAFLAPTLHRLAANPRSLSDAARRNGPRCLVLAPTRELALQTLRFYKAYGRELNPPVRATVIVGGTPLEAQFEALAVCPEIVIATPGRLLQMLAEMGMKGGLTLSSVETFIVDEADRLFEGTLAQETAAVIAQLTPEADVNSDRQTILVSATMPHALADFTRSCLRRNAEVIRLDADKTLSPTLATAFAMTRSGDEKVASLMTVMRRILAIDESKSVVVFAATHRAVEYIVVLLRKVLNLGSVGGKSRRTADTSRAPVIIADSNVSEAATAADYQGVVCVHGNMDQGARVEAVAHFRKRLARVLVVTDVAARGIDLPDLDVVINYDMPCAPKVFVHRVGRVGRAGRPGIALNLVSSDEAPYMIDTLLFLGRGVSLSHDKLTNPAEDSSDDAWQHHSVAMASSFIVGSLPKSLIDDDVEALNKTIAGSRELDKLRHSSNNAHGLYTKTRSLASGESVRRAKTMYDDGHGGKRDLPVHPWFQSMESIAERIARHHASLLSTWRPKDMPVTAPGSLDRKRALAKVEHEANTATIGSAGNKSVQVSMDGDDIDGNDVGDISDADDAMDTAGDAATQKSIRLLVATAASVVKNGTSAINVSPKRAKRNARQEALEAQKAKFFVPLRRGDAEVQTEQALRLGRGGSMADVDGLGAFRAIQDATMDLVADTNVGLLREKHAGRKDAMFWDRVSKKFVKGGVTKATSRQNVHVATREAKARAAGGMTANMYGTADGAMFKAWLNKNKKACDAQREALSTHGAVPRQNDGLGSNDFRRGAFGRSRRIAAIGAKQRANDGGGQPAPKQGTIPAFRKMRTEIKTAPQIRKERNVKKNEEARRIGKSKSKARPSGGPVMPRPEKRGGGGFTRSRVMVKGAGFKMGSRKR
jgi:superfamily II DNA/RNA helicase